MDWNNTAALRAACGASLIAGAIGAAMAHGNATGVVADRMNGMMDMARSIKQLTEAIDSGSVESAIIEETSQTIRRHAGETMVTLFPEGSTDSPSEASPAIWENWREFSELAHRLHELGGELARSAITPSDGSATQASTPAPQTGESIWASLDERALLGLAPKPVVQPEPALASVPEAPSLTATLGAITGTCSQCHEAFRRGKQ